MQDGAATSFLVNFHEQARRATQFHYQNDWGLILAQVKLITVEEVLHSQHGNTELVQAMNRYYKGLAHPVRAFCGLAKGNPEPLAAEELKGQLLEARAWLTKYNSRMTTALSEWSAGWRLVRDLEAALALTSAGVSLQRHQFSATTPDGLREEIGHQRRAMVNQEELLRDFEGHLETRIACCLELLWREPASALPDKMSEVQRHLPRWVLIYEALGIHLPDLREIITSFHAFASGFHSTRETGKASISSLWKMSARP
jgi:hypothetical protein